ncbi:MAG TPA: DUF222 domain-containing protein, partial [Streptosporangiaceae bacterium]|jgi:hypothetical protein
MTTAIAEADLELAWTQLPPGPELVLHLATVDWASLPDRELVAALEAAGRLTAWVQSMQLTAVAELARRRQGPDYQPDSDTERRTAGEVSLALTSTQGQAEELVWLAETLPERLPATWAALRHGLIDYDRAKIMCDALGGLDSDLARGLDAELIGDAVDSTRTVLRRKLTKAIKAADPDAYTERARQANDERRVELWDNPETDTCDLIGRNIDPPDAHAIYNRLTAAAQAMKADGDLRSISQIRLDLHTALLRGTPLPEAARDLRIVPATASNAPTDANAVRNLLAPEAARDLLTDPATARNVVTETGAGGDAATSGRRPAEHETDTTPPASSRRQMLPHRSEAPADLTAVVTAVEKLIAHALAEVTDEQLTGLVDRARAAGRLDSLSLLIGQAVQTMNNALAGLVDGWCRATGTNPGRHGHPGYRPPAAMQRLVQRRHPTCVFPTCNRRAAHCDLDHTVPHHKGGRTCKCNLAPLCRTHHRVIKQHPSWTLLQPWPGLLVWITPAGNWHIVTPQ